MIGLCPLASGSKGNATLFSTGKTKLLIDAGITTKQLEVRLASLDVALDEIDAILITHEHSDHIKALPVLLRKRQIPILTNSATAREIYSYIGGPANFKLFTTGEPFEFGDILINPFSVQHDAVDPVMFTLEAAQWKVGICTDLGFVTTLVTSQLQGCNHLIIEANHQPSMVHASNRSPVYKRRVLSRLGHLSNEECLSLILDLHHEGLEHIYLAHLSSECNCSEFALNYIQEGLRKHNINTTVHIASQDKPSFPLTLHSASEVDEAILAVTTEKSLSVSERSSCS